MTREKREQLAQERKQLDQDLQNAKGNIQGPEVVKAIEALEQRVANLEAAANLDVEVNQ